MINRIFFSLITLCVSICVSVRLEAAMVRVVGVVDGQTLVVEREGVATHVKLAGITITDDDGARSLMKWTLGSSWVMLEEQPDGGHFVYRSPDALFINRELVARGFARATLPAIEPHSHVVITYLGTTYAPAVAAAQRRGDALREGAAAKSPTASGSGSGRTSRTPAKRSPPHRRRKP
jgi:endonuclease YncB( thermonuclease family)